MLLWWLPRACLCGHCVLLNISGIEGLVCYLPPGLFITCSYTACGLVKPTVKPKVKHDSLSAERSMLELSCSFSCNILQRYMRQTKEKLRKWQKQSHKKSWHLLHNHHVVTTVCCFLYQYLPPLSSEYEIVSPYEVDHQGQYISHGVAHHQRRRRRRSLNPDEASSSTNSDSETVHFRLSGLGQDFHMELSTSSETLIAPGFTVQILGKNGTKSLRAYHQDDLCFYQGSLRSRVNSSVALSTCMGMVSLSLSSLRLQESLYVWLSPNQWASVSLRFY